MKNLRSAEKFLYKGKKLAFVACLLAFYPAFTQPKDGREKVPDFDSSRCLEITGKLNKSVAGIGDYRVEVLFKNQVVDSSVAQNRKPFKFRLWRNADYSLRINKKGYLPKLVSVSTKLPSAISSYKLYRFFMDVKLIPEGLSGKIDPDDIDFPIALIAYDQHKKCFRYDKKYTEAVKARIKRKIPQ